MERIEHVPPGEHPAFYAASRFTLNVTRGDMIRAGYSPSVRLFEAAACGMPIVSDVWDGIETILAPDREIVLAREPEDILAVLLRWPTGRAQNLAEAARRRVLAAHTSAHRARELEHVLMRAVSGARRWQSVQAAAGR